MAIRTTHLTRTHRERLLKNGFLREVVKGWYTPTRPDEAPGESTAWYTSFWAFCADYLNERFGEDWQHCSLRSVLGPTRGAVRRLSALATYNDPCASQRPATTME